MCIYSARRTHVMYIEIYIIIRKMYGPLAAVFISLFESRGKTLLWLTDGNTMCVHLFALIGCMLALLTSD